MAVGKNVFRDHEKDDRKRRQMARVTEADRRERSRNRWIKANREKWLSAGCPEDISRLVKDSSSE